MIPDDLIDKTVEKINRSPVVYTHFFSNINNPAWLIPLKERGFFTEPAPAIRENGYVRFPAWPESGYLLRIAEHSPDEVLAIIKALPETDNERVMDDVVGMLLKMDVSKSFRMTELVKRYVNSSQFLLLSRTASQFISRLASGGYDRPAIGLAKEMLEILPDPEKEEKLKSDYVMIKPTAKYSDHDYKEIVQEITPSLVESNPFSTIDMYAELLQKAIDFELTFFKEDGEELALEEKTDDFSFISRPNIAEDKEYGNDPEDTLTDALRDSVVALMENEAIGNIDKLSKLKELVVNKYSIFKRIVEFALRKYKDDADFSDFYNSVIQDEKLKTILQGEKDGLNKVTTGFVIERPTDLLKGLSDTKILDMLKTYKDESGWSFERDSIAKELGELAKADPGIFIKLMPELALTRNEYLYEVIQAFEETIDNLDSTNISDIISALVKIFEVGSGVVEGEKRDYYSWCKSSAIRFMEKALSKRDDGTERVSIEAIDVMTSLLLLLSRETNPEDENEAKLDPVDWSVNSIRGNAMHGFAYLLDWMNRNEVDREKYEPIFNELDWHLDPDNDSSPAIRSVYGWRFEVFYGSDEAWALKNMDKIFSNDELGKMAFDAYAMFNRVHEGALKILGDVFKKQISRFADTPLEDAKFRRNGLKNFTQHIALHYWYTPMDLSEGSLMYDLLNTANKKYIKELANFIGFRLYKSSETEIEAEQLEKLANLWDAIADLVKADDDKSTVLEEFGGWFASGKLDPKWSLEQLAFAASNADNINLDFAVLDRMEKLIKDYPAESLTALDAMIDGAKEHWAVSSWSKNLTVIIQHAYKNGDQNVKEQAVALANKLVAKGYTEYRKVVGGE